jgi:TldD protein
MNLAETELLSQLGRLQTARALLLEPYDLDEAKLQGALAEIFRHRGVDFADLYFQHKRVESWTLEEGIVKSGSFDIEQGVGVRAVAGDKSAFAYSDELTQQALLEAARTVRGIAAHGNGARTRLARRMKTPKTAALYGNFDPLAALDSDAKVALLQGIDRAVRAKDPRIKQVVANLTAVYDVVLVARSDGVLAADVRPMVRMNLFVIAEQKVDGEMRSEIGTAGSGGRVALSRFGEPQVQQLVDEAVHAALINLEARPAPAGEMSVVLGAGWPGILLHEAVGHGLEGDFNRKGTSVFAGRIGERVAAKGVTVIDDGTLPGRRGSLNIDDEGQPTQRNVLIEDGILRGYLQDSMNARLMGVAPTGNGRRESFAHLPMPRMTNTYMLAGREDPREIVASLKRGLYAVNFGGGQVDITSGKFVFSASEAYWVENGKIQYPVRGATLIGNGPESLKRVSMIGHDLRLDPGVGICGKDGQSVPVGVGQPTLRIERMTVGGTEA